jgi:hypothetical protein
MDYRYPLSAFQAFAICLSSFDTKLACEWEVTIIGGQLPVYWRDVLTGKNTWSLCLQLAEWRGLLCWGRLALNLCLITLEERQAIHSKSVENHSLLSHVL